MIFDTERIHKKAMEKFSADTFYDVSLRNPIPEQIIFIQSKEFRGYLKAIFAIDGAFALKSYQIMDLINERNRDNLKERNIDTLYDYQSTFDNVYYEFLTEFRIKNKIPITFDEAIKMQHMPESERMEHLSDVQKAWGRKRNIHQKRRKYQRKDKDGSKKQAETVEEQPVVTKTEDPMEE
eukprot:NODE_109_length_18665_cov_0.924486.p15 type:complete len:180 gc:universal NODE_109_length_18665_cov_0.924486:13875-13336(-)